MNTTARSLLLVLILALGVAGSAAVYFMMQGPPAPEPSPVAPETQPTEQPETPVESPSVTLEPSVRTEPTTGRSELPAQPDAREAAQGFTGRVLAPNHAAVPDATVYLMEGVGSNDLLRMMAMVQSGVIRPPLATGRTGPDGAFRLGVAVFDPTRVYEFRVATEDHVELRLPNLRLTKEGEWFPLGNQVLQTGAVAAGRVTAQGSGGVGIPEATVTFRNASGFPDLSPTPGREGGISVTTDASGNYRATNIPVGVLHIAAVAPGYARMELQNVPISMEGTNDHNFDLPMGLSISGICVDPAGHPVANVKLTALAISSKTPGTSETRSRSDGKFELMGLVEGPYILTYMGEGFVRGEYKPAQAGEKDLQITLERLGIAKLQVFSKDNRLMSNYQVSLKTFHEQEGQAQYGNTELSGMRARPDKDGITTISGIAPNDRQSYVFQIEAAEHAMAFSDPFDVKIGMEPPFLIVRMNEGGILEGQVTNEVGAGLPGVQVQTMPNEYDENPFTKMFAGMIPVKITRTGVVTDGEGRYRLRLLNPGAYQLRFTHPKYFEVFQKNHQVVAGETTRVPTLQMQPGTMVTGTVLVDGAPGGQIKVTIANTPPAADTNIQMPGATKQQSPQMFHDEAFTDAEGMFTFTRRIPPGRYTIRAMRQSSNPSDIFRSMIDSLRSQQELELYQNETERKIQILIDSNDQRPLQQLQNPPR